MVANGSEPREILLDPMIAGSRGTDGCVFDREVDRECSPRVDSLDMMGSVELVEEPAQNSAAIGGRSSSYKSDGPLAHLGPPNCSDCSPQWSLPPRSPLGP